MLLAEDEVESRLQSGFNLLNQLKSITKQHRDHTPILSIPPKSEELFTEDELAEKLALTGTKTKALAIMDKCLNKLNETATAMELPPAKLSSIIKDMSQVVKNMEPESDKKENNQPQFIIYSPQLMQEAEFEVIEVKE